MNLQRPLISTVTRPNSAETNKNGIRPWLPLIVARQVTRKKSIRVLFVLSVCGFLLTTFYTLRLYRRNDDVVFDALSPDEIAPDVFRIDGSVQPHLSRQWRRGAENNTIANPVTHNSIQSESKHPSSELVLEIRAPTTDVYYTRWYLSANRVPGVDLSTASNNSFVQFLRNETFHLSSTIPVWPHDIFNTDYEWLSPKKSSVDIVRRQQKPFIMRLPRKKLATTPNDGRLRSYHDRIEFQMLANTQNITFINETFSRKPKRILLTSGTWWWGAKTASERRKVFDGCPINRCELRVPDELKPLGISKKLNDKNRKESNITYESLDAVLTHALQLLPVANQGQHLTRPPDSLHQLWIYYALESPYYNKFSSYDNMFDDMINWTATYRLDSDIVAPYDKWTAYQNEPPTPNDSIKTRRDMWSQKLDSNETVPRARALALISNCNAAGRLAAARELQSAGIEVDVFGGCGSRSAETARNNHDDFLRTASQRYHFFLAFENSRCRSYITEKFFFNGLNFGMIPIVRGATKVDYEIAAPTNSFIFADDFKSIGALAKYMQILARNKDLYNSYFAWIGTGEFMNTNFWCRLCAMLWHHDLNNQPRKWYSSIVKWWEGNAEDGTQTCVDETLARWTDSEWTVKTLHDYEQYVRLS